jgi:hypothetical protein
MCLAPRYERDQVNARDLLDVALVSGGDRVRERVEA